MRSPPPPPGSLPARSLENLRVDFSRDSIDALTGHFKNTFENRILILYRNFSQAAADSRRPEPTRGACNRLL